MREMEERPDYNLFHVALVIVSAELVCGLKGNYFGGTIIFTMVLKILCDYNVLFCISLRS